MENQAIFRVAASPATRGEGMIVMKNVRRTRTVCEFAARFCRFAAASRRAAGGVSPYGEELRTAAHSRPSQAPRASKL